MLYIPDMAEEEGQSQSISDEITSVTVAKKEENAIPKRIVKESLRKRFVRKLLFRNYRVEKQETRRRMN